MVEGDSGRTAALSVKDCIALIGLEADIRNLSIESEIATKITMTTSSRHPATEILCGIEVYTEDKDLFK